MTCTFTMALVLAGVVRPLIGDPMRVRLDSEIGDG
jgi:hypothetical protein